MRTQIWCYDHNYNLQIEELFEFYSYGHFMKFVARGARRIESSPGNKELNNIAFRNPDGAISLVVVNTTKAAKPFAVTWKGKAFRTELGARSVSTFVWK
ncbi:MAG: hypothetical protein DME25_10015 [Verrucomicrobia bacterium]|nr:MAG: hypothetical protein DME25_10015 [Verrucomicrobiota bacterium]